MRLQEDGSELKVLVEKKEKVDEKIEDSRIKASKAECLDALREMIKHIEQLPMNAMYTPVTQADQLSLLLLISTIFDCTD
jgi:hypothetical protein